MRITPGELEALGRGEAIEETLRFGGSASWVASLVPAVATQFAVVGSLATVTLSPEDCARLADPEAEGVYFTADDFRYFVEKDFPCAHPRAAEALEPETSTFAPPPGFNERKN